MGKTMSPSRAFGPVAKAKNAGEEGYYEYSKEIERLGDEAWAMKKAEDEDVNWREGAVNWEKTRRGIVLKAKPSRKNLKGPQLDKSRGGSPSKSKSPNKGSPKR